MKCRCLQAESEFTVNHDRRRRRHLTRINERVNNPSLVHAILALYKNNTKGNRKKVFREVLKAQFMCPVAFEPTPASSGKNEKIVLKRNTKIRFHMIENTQLQYFYLAFTDLDELKKWNPSANQHSIILTFDEYASMILQDGSDTEGFIINFGGTVLTMTRDMIVSLKKVSDERKIADAAEKDEAGEIMVKLMRPRIYPMALLRAVCEFLKTQKCVQAAYMQLMLKEEQESYLLIIDYTGDSKSVYTGILSAAAPYLDGIQLNMAPYHSVFGRKAAADIEPFYRKKII